MVSPLSENITTIVNSSAMSVIGLIRGMNTLSYQSRPFAPDQDEPREHPGEERDAEVDEHALGDLPHRDVDRPRPRARASVGSTVMKNQA